MTIANPFQQDIELDPYKKKRGVNRTLLQILTDEYYKRNLKARGAAARKWFMQYVNSKPMSPYTLMNGVGKAPRLNSFVGGLFFFIYSAKHKKTLPYWDKFPLVIPLDVSKTGFTGLNLHYVDYRTRARLLDNILTVTYNYTITPTTKLEITWNMCKSIRKLKALQPCIHSYLWDQLQSQFLPIQPEQWDVAIFLPVERFQKVAKEDVWAQSRKH